MNLRGTGSPCCSTTMVARSQLRRGRPLAAQSGPGSNPLAASRMQDVRPPSRLWKERGDDEDAGRRRPSRVGSGIPRSRNAQVPALPAVVSAAPWRAERISWERNVHVRSAGVWTAGMRTASVLTAGVRTAGVRTACVRTAGVRTACVRTACLRRACVRTAGVVAVGCLGSDWPRDPAPDLRRHCREPVSQQPGKVREPDANRVHPR